MTREEMIRMVRRIQTLDGTEEQIDCLIVALRETFPHAKVSDLIHYPPNRRELTAEQIVDEALRRERAWRELQG
jgi:hypothetical protein